MVGKKLKYFFPLLGILLFGYILIYIVDFKILLPTVKSIDLIFFIPVFLLIFPQVGLKAWRWKILLKQQNINYSFYATFSMYTVGTFFSLVTPGKIGEVVKIFYLKQDNHKLKPSLVSIIIDRLLDMVVLLIFLFLGFLIFIKIFSQEIIYLSFFTVGNLFLIYFIIKSKIYLKVLRFIIPSRYHTTIYENSKDFFKLFKNYTLYHYSIGIIITISSWLIYTWQIYLLGLSLDLNLNFLFLIPMIASASAIDLLPISINGLGTREAVFIFFFGMINLSPEKATILGILQLFIVFSTSFIGLVCWLKKPVKLS